MARSNRWVFTLNNYEDADVDSLARIAESPDCVYLVYGRERAPSTDTPHLQGFVIFSTRKRLGTLRLLFPRCHLETARGSNVQASDYAKKDGDYEEFGVLPTPDQGRRSDITEYVDWLKAFDGVPSEREIALAWPSLFVRYRRNLVQLRDFVTTPAPLEAAAHRPWQLNLKDALIPECTDDRKILFYVDKDGGAGKSWFVRKMITDHEDRVQFLSVGKRDDIAHALNESKDIFLFSVPRGGMEYLNYHILEMIKDRLVFSPKYDSRVKRLAKVPHVVVFSNEDPDEEKLTHDRYAITRLS